MSSWAVGCSRRGCINYDRYMEVGDSVTYEQIITYQTIHQRDLGRLIAKCCRILCSVRKRELFSSPFRHSVSRHLAPRCRDRQDLHICHHGYKNIDNRISLISCHLYRKTELFDLAYLAHYLSVSLFRSQLLHAIALTRPRQ